MNSLISFSPFIVLIYALFALVQAIRHQRQGWIAALVAVVALVIPFVIYLSSDVLSRPNLMSSMALSAGILCLTSIIVLFIERRDSKRDKQRSYGILGIVMSLVLAVGLVAVPMPSTSSLQTVGQTSSNAGLVNVSVSGAAGTINNQAMVASSPTSEFDSLDSGNQTQAQVPLTETSAVVDATAAPTEVVIRPTLITFPSATPTPAIAIVASTQSATTQAVENSLATCTIVIDYNLNLRDKPTVEDSRVLVSIPFGSTVTTNGRNADNWYKVIYDGKTGWVSGDYVTAQVSCSQLPELSG